MRWCLLGLVVAGTLLVGGCQREKTTAPPEPDPAAARNGPDSDKPMDDPKVRAVAARDALFQALSMRLMQAMATGGPAGAIEICSQEARRLADQVGHQYNVSIGRTSFKLRNPKNTPPDWARPLVESRTEEPQFLTLPDGRTAALLPIRLQGHCVTCHGPDDQIPQEVKEALARLYPEDQARGFLAGDLRGWFWVEVPARPQEGAPSGQ